MQTVVMSFGRNLCLGKPDLPIYHLHVYLPVQLIHKLVERMGVLRFRDVTPEEGKRYKHNSDNEANNPYIIVGPYEGQCVSNDYPEFPNTPRLAYAYEQGLLDGSFGQMVSFQSSYKSIFRLEVPVWHNVADGLAVAQGDPKAAAATGMAEPVSTGEAQASGRKENFQGDVEAAPAPESDEEDNEEDTYVVPAGQGSFSFQQGLLLRAKETYSKRSVGNKYEIISKWLLTGLAVVISRTNWNILSKNRTLTMTPRNILHACFSWGYPADEEDKTRKPYAQPHPNSLLPATWQDQVSWMSHAGYLQVTEEFNAARMRQGYYGTINH